MKPVATLLAVLAVSLTQSCATGTSKYRSKDATDLSKYISQKEFRKLWRLAKLRETPIYPYNMLRISQPGCVLVGIHVDSNGQVLETEIVKRWPEVENFIEPAVRSISKNVYEPTDQNSLKQPIWSVEIVTFEIENKAPYGNELYNKCAT